MIKKCRVKKGIKEKAKVCSVIGIKQLILSNRPPISLSNRKNQELLHHPILLKNLKKKFSGILSLKDIESMDKFLRIKRKSQGTMSMLLHHHHHLENSQHLHLKTRE